MTERLSEDISVNVRSETATSRKSARVIVYKNNTPIAEIEARIDLEQGADGGQYNVVKLKRKETTSTPPK